MDKSGLDNRIFLTDSNEDLDRIEVITTSTSSSHSDLQSQYGQEHNSLNINTISFRHGAFAGNGNHLTDSKKACSHSSREGSDDHCGDESIELISSAFGALRIRTSSPLTSLVNGSRGATPTNMVRRWSQTLARFDKDKHSIREKNIYRLPSRKLFEVEGNLFASSQIEPDSDIELLVKEIEQHDGLMQDTALSHQHRLETLRALPQRLYVKRLLKQKLSITIEQQTSVEHRRNWCHILSNVLIYAFLKIWAAIGVVKHNLEIWYDALKTIEGHFGSNVSSYFKFLRWLFMLNTLMLICIFGFIVLPQMVYNSLASNDLNVTTVLDNNNTAELQKEGDLFVNLLTGQGQLQSSLLFYGSYLNVSFSQRGAHTGSYSIPHAYFMTMLLLYLFTFIFISTSMARSYRISFIKSIGDKRNMLAQKLFCAWDFSISNIKSADLKHVAIFSELKEVLTDLNDPEKPNTVLWQIWIICSRLVAHVLVFALVAMAGFGVWLILETLDVTDTEVGWKTLSTAVILNVTLFVMQCVLSWISKMEDYRTPRRTLHMALMRNFLLEIVIIGVIMYFLLTKKYNKCWETRIGQELYRFVLMDSFICLIAVPLIGFVRVWLSRRYWPRLGCPEFDISQKSLGLVYNQTLLWLGLIFAPLLVFIVVAKMLLTFYINKTMLLRLCRSPRHVWRSSQTQTLYLVFTFLSLLGVIVTLGYIMTQLHVSAECGPFQGYHYMFQIFIDGVLRLRENETLWRILTLLIRPGAVGILLVIMSIMVYYLRAKSRARCLMVKMLKEMIYLEVKDKEFLLGRITNITKKRESLLDTQKLFATSTRNEPTICQRSTQENSENSGTSRSDGFILRSRNV